MPSTNGLEVLCLSEKPLTKEKWCEFLETRRAIIKPSLDQWTLKSVGKLEYLRSHMQGVKHTLEADTPIVPGGAEKLKIQGVYPEHYRIASVTMRRAHFWGISRKGEWLLGKIEFAIEPDKYERAIEVSIRGSSVKEIISCSGFEPIEIADELYAHIHNRFLHHEQRCRELGRIKKAMEMERKVIELMNAR